MPPLCPFELYFTLLTYHPSCSVPDHHRGFAARDIWSRCTGFSTDQTGRHEHGMRYPSPRCLQIEPPQPSCRMASDVTCNTKVPKSCNTTRHGGNVGEALHVAGMR